MTFIVCTRCRVGWPLYEFWMVQDFWLEHTYIIHWVGFHLEYACISIIFVGFAFVIFILSAKAGEEYNGKKEIFPIGLSFRVKVKLGISYYWGLVFSGFSNVLAKLDLVWQGGQNGNMLNSPFLSYFSRCGFGNFIMILLPEEIWSMRVSTCLLQFQLRSLWLCSVVNELKCANCN